MFLHMYIVIMLAGLQIPINAAQQEAQASGAAQDDTNLPSYGKAPKKRELRSAATKSPYTRPVATQPKEEVPTPEQQLQPMLTLQGIANIAVTAHNNIEYLYNFTTEQTKIFNTHLATMGNRLKALEDAAREKEEAQKKIFEAFKETLTQQSAQIEALQKHAQLLQNTSYIMTSVAAQQQLFLNQYNAMKTYVDQLTAIQQPTPPLNSTPRSQEAIRVLGTPPPPSSLQHSSTSPITFPTDLQPTS